MVTSFILCIIFINDRDELAIRVNAGYILKRFVDCYSSKEEPKEYIRLLKDIVLPNLKLVLEKIMKMFKLNIFWCWNTLLNIQSIILI